MKMQDDLHMHDDAGSPVLDNSPPSCLHPSSLLKIIKTMHAVHVDCFTALAEDTHTVTHVSYGEHVA